MQAFVFENRPCRNGLTLTELLVVIAVIGILVGLLIPAVQSVRESSRLTHCKNNLRQISIATQNYATSHLHYPAGGISAGETGSQLSLALHVSLLPLIDQKNIYDRFDRTQAYYADENLRLTLNKIPAFLCPSAPIQRTFGSPITAENIDGINVFTTHYYGVAGPLGLNSTTGVQYDFVSTSFGHGPIPTQGLFFPDRETLRSDIDDGASNSLAFAEYSWSTRGGQSPQYRAWSAGPGLRNDGEPSYNLSAKAVHHPINSDVMQNSNSWTFGSEHPGGASFAAADGSTHFIAEQIDLGVYLALASINGSETNAAFE